LRSCRWRSLAGVLRSRLARSAAVATCS
jgi:hypothetical protein